MSAAGERGETARTYGRAGADGPAQLARTDAEIVKLKGMVSALTGRVLALESAQPEPSPANQAISRDGYIKNTDPSEPSEADKVAMRENLRSRTLAGIKANHSDPSRAGGPITRDGFDVE